MTFIKKNKKLICVLIGLILFMVLVVLFVKALLPDSSKTTWGNRGDLIVEHPLTDEELTKLKEEILATGKVSEIKFLEESKNKYPLLSFIIYVNDDVDRGAASGLLSYFTNNISKENQELYDIQVYFEKNGEDASFPFIGYKHKTSSGFSIGG